MSAWYVVRTHPRAERTALEHLRRQDFGAYLPQYRKSRRHARRTDTVVTPLFPRYLFVNFDIARSRWRSILSTIGICQLISEGDSPIALPEGIVEEIRAREDVDGMIAMQAEAPFAPGDAVQITSGPMSDHVGFFSGLSDKDRVFVLLDLLGRRIKVQFPTKAVAAYL